MYAPGSPAQSLKAITYLLHQSIYPLREPWEYFKIDVRTLISKKRKSKVRVSTIYMYIFKAINNFFHQIYYSQQNLIYDATVVTFIICRLISNPDIVPLIR